MHFLPSIAYCRPEWAMPLFLRQYFKKIPSCTPHSLLGWACRTHHCSMRLSSCCCLATKCASSLARANWCSCSWRGIPPLSLRQKTVNTHKARQADRQYIVSETTRPSTHKNHSKSTILRNFTGKRRDTGDETTLKHQRHQDSEGSKCRRV